MGSSNPYKEIVTPFPLANGTYAGGESPKLDFDLSDWVTLVFDITALTGVTAFKFKFQVLVGTDWADLYKDSGDGTFIVDELTIPIAASTPSQRRVIRIDARSMSGVRIVSQAIGGTATLNAIHSIRDGSETATPRL